MAVFDTYDRYYDKALEAFCCNYRVESKDLNDDQMDKIIEKACVHIGFYITWMIKNHLEGNHHKENNGLYLEKVRKEEITGVDFFMTCCDGKLWSDDFNYEGLVYSEYYYSSGQYMKDYVSFVFEELNDLPCEFDFNWEEYKLFEPVLDKRWQIYCSQEHLR